MLITTQSGISRTGVFGWRRQKAYRKREADPHGKAKALLASDIAAASRIQAAVGILEAAGYEVNLETAVQVLEESGFEVGLRLRDKPRTAPKPNLKHRR